MSKYVCHPLEPPSASEVQHAVRLLRSHEKVTPTTRFVSVSLKEPRKQLVRPRSSWNAISREAFVVLFDNGTNSCNKAHLSLTENPLLSWKNVPGVQSTMTIDEQIECDQAARRLFVCTLVGLCTLGLRRGRPN